MNSRSFPVSSANAMDIARPPKNRSSKVSVTVAGLLVLAAAVAWSMHAIGAAPKGSVVDQATIVTDTVVLGTLTRTVSAPGTFVSQHVRLTAASEEGFVERVFVRPGSAVSTGTRIAQITNPTLLARVVDAQSQVAVAQANITSGRQQREANQLTRKAAIADAQAQEQQTTIQERSMSGLVTEGLVPVLSYRKAQIDAEKARNAVMIARAQLTVSGADDDAKIAALQAQLAQLQEALRAAHADVASLTVRAGAPGIVQNVAVDDGAHVAQGAELARIADQRSLKAVLHVPESALTAVMPGMKARIETSTGALVGRVTQIAPSAQNGTVLVDVNFDRPLPPGLRPDSNLTGAIELARLPNVLSIARPANVVDGTSIDAFRLVDAGTRAVRVTAKFGTGSTDRIQVVSGLAAGDTVIISDTSAYAGAADLRLR
jgi:HlyD family secretion protein